MKKYVMVTALIIICLQLFGGCAPEETVTETPEKAIPLSLETMKRDQVEYTYVAVGEVVPGNQVDLFIGGGGYIEELMVGLGDSVETGTLLVRLDGSEVDMSNYYATESQLRTVRDNLGSQLASVRDTVVKQERLFEQGQLTASELDASRLQLENLEREYANAQSAYRNQLAVIKDGLEEVSDSRIIESQVTGTVAAVYIEEGQQANGQLGITIIDESNSYISTSVSSELKKQLTVGEAVRLTLDDEHEMAIEGIVSKIQTLPDSETKLFEVQIDFEENDRWIIGDYVEVMFVLDSYDALMVPAASIVRKGEQKYIYTYKDEALTKVYIEAGRSKDDWIEVRNLTELSDVVVRGQEQLQSADSPYEIVE